MFYKTLNSYKLIGKSLWA